MSTVHTQYFFTYFRRSVPAKALWVLAKVLTEKKVRVSCVLVSSLAALPLRSGQERCLGWFPRAKKDIYVDVRRAE